MKVEVSAIVMAVWMQSIVQSLSELAFIFFIAAFVPFHMVAKEYSRPSKTGEINIPRGAEGGLPAVVLFNDLLPRARGARLAFVMLMGAAAVCAVAAVLIKYLVH